MPKLTASDLNAKGPLCRAMEVREFNSESRTVELAFSSETEVDRWFGIEILDHSPGAIRLDRLQSGAAALLVNHDPDDQVGVVESVTIDADKVGRALVRFGRSARAQEIFQDVVDGIRKLVSVQYRIRGLKLDETRDGVDVYRITDWEPYEISIVSIPADPSVGVGRAAAEAADDEELQALVLAAKAERSATADDQEITRVADDLPPAETPPEMPTNQREAAMPASNQTPPADTPDLAAAERERARSIAAVGAQFGASAADVSRFIDEGRSLSDFQSHLLQARASQPMNEQMRANEIGLTDKEARSFSFTKLLRAVSTPEDRNAQKEAGFELEACRAAADKLDHQARGIVIPVDAMTRAFSPFNTGKTGTDTGDTGGYSVATDLQASSFVDMLRNRAVLLRKATALGGLVGNIDVPRQVGSGNITWIGEDGAAGDASQALDQIQLTPKTASAKSEITRRLLMQSSLDVELLVRRDLATIMALGIDRAGFYGSGTSHQPKGIANYTGINAVDWGGAGSNTADAPGTVLPTFAEFVQMETEIAADNADVGSLAYVMNARMRGHCKTALKFAAAGSATIWEPGNTVNGYAAEVTNQIGVGDVFFGNFADLIVGLWGGLEINVDPYTHSATGKIRIVTFQDVDFVLRRTESFCLGRDKTKP